MQSQKIKISVIVLFYHGERWIDSCIRSLENQSLDRDLYEIILVDNGGSTPSVDAYKGQKNITTIHFPENYGFAGGNNRAMDHARGELILLMNQDVVVHYNCLEELLTAFELYPEAGAISANMLMVSSKEVMDPYASIPKTVGLYRLSSFGYTSYTQTETEKDILPVDFVSGNALGFRRTILENVGNNLFDSLLGSYAEDLDLSIRLKKTDWKMYVRPNAVVYHFREEAFWGKPSYMLGKLIHISANRLIVYYNNLGATNFIKKLPSLLLGIPLKVTRLDGDNRIGPLRFVIALGVLPLILIYFGLRVLANIEFKREKPGISEKVQKSRKRWKSYIQVIMLVLFCGLGSLFLYDQDWEKIKTAIYLFNWKLILLLIGLTICSHIAMTIRTKIVFHRIGYPTRFATLLSVGLASQFSSRMTPAQVGIFISVPLFKKCFQIPLGYGSLFVVVDKLFGLYFMGCFALIGILGYMIGRSEAIFILFFILLFLAWIFFRIIRICDEAIHRFGVPKYGGDLLYHLGTDLPSQLAICFSKLILYSINIALFLIIARELDYSINIMRAWLVISVSFLTGVVSMIPFGLISRDASIIALSSYAGVPGSIGLIISLLMRVISIPKAILGIFCGLWLGKKHFS